MPIYEFYCKDCHTIYNFYSGRVNIRKAPVCPDAQCNNSHLERQVSLFSISRGRTESDASSDMDDIDEDKLEKAMMSLSGEIDNLDENDPRQAARVMRKLFDSTGMSLGNNIEEAICRMEAGEDPDRIEQEMGDVLEDENPFSAKPRNLLNDLRRKYIPPKVDEHLHEL